MHAIYYKRDGHPAVPVLLETATIADTSVQFGHLIVDSTEQSRADAVKKFVKSRGLENVPGQFLLVKLEEVEVEIVRP